MYFKYKFNISLKYKTVKVLINVPKLTLIFVSEKILGNKRGIQIRECGRRRIANSSYSDIK